MIVSEEHHTKTERVGDVSVTEESHITRYPFDPLRAQKKESWFHRMSNECCAMRAMVHSILFQSFTRPESLRWTVQGFGMLRAYLPYGGSAKRFRLNVWNADLAVPNVSVIHDHPWSFDSWIINGRFGNVRFVEDYHNGDAYDWMKIRTGEEAGKQLAARSRIRLRSLPVEHYTTGDKYHQDADEIHLSAYADGTVTLNDRVGDTEHARVFWPAGQEWVDAKPREATRKEISEGIHLALELWEPNVGNAKAS